MKALSLWQPFPTVIATGHKTSETRSWPAPASLIGERLGVHAAKRALPAEDWPARLVDVVANALGLEDLLACDEPAAALLSELVYGAMMATVTVTACRQVVAHDRIRGGSRGQVELPVAVLDAGGGARTSVLIDGLGDYSIGRWVWQFGGREALDPPVPVRGAQGLWEWRGASR